MGSLSNLYISQSYQSLLHFGNDSSASTTLVELQDGVGNGLGVSLNTLGDLDIERQLIVHTGAEITGAVDINTTFSGSTQGFVNQSSINNQIQITGSYTPTGNQASITEIGMGWLVNGGAVSNGRVIGITGTPNSNVTYTIDQFYTANNVTYTFTGSIQREVEIEGDLNVSDDLFVGGHLIIEDGVEITGSIDITGAVTASNAFIENDLIVSGTIYAYEIITTIESSSVIFSSGSNILGDSILDTQTLNGTIIMSGSSSLTGSMGITGNLNVLGEISSSTINGIGNVTTFSQSVDYRLDNLETYSGSSENKFAAIQTYTSSMNVYTQSINAEIDSLQLFTASVGLVTTASYNAYTTSTNARLDSIEIATSSLQIFSASAKIQLANLELTTASLNNSVSNLNTFTASNNITSLNAYTSSNNTKWTTIGNLTGSYATTGSNTFVGNQIITGSLRANVGVLNVAGGTANIDCSLGNFFTLNLPSSSTTALTATNIQPGQTISLKIKQLATSGATTGSLTYPTYIKFPQYGNYNPSPFSGAVDVLSFVAFDTTTLYAVNVRNMNY